MLKSYVTITLYARRCRYVDQSKQREVFKYPGYCQAGRRFNGDGLPGAQSPGADLARDSRPGPGHCPGASLCAEPDGQEPLLPLSRLHRRLCLRYGEPLFHRPHPGAEPGGV